MTTIDLNCVSYGNAGVPLVLLHGLNESLASFRPLLEPLAQIRESMLSICADMARQIGQRIDIRLLITPQMSSHSWPRIWTNHPCS